MDMFNIFASSPMQKSTMVEFLCPSCGKKCQNNDRFCTHCAYDLDEYKKDILAPYKYYNSAIQYAEHENYFAAIVDISKFLAFYPNDLDANKFYIYLLYKNGQQEAYFKAIEAFEEKFIRNPWIMEIETHGIDSYQIPTVKCEDVDGNENVFISYTDKYVSDRIKTANDIFQLVLEFYDIVRVYNGKNAGQRLQKFYETNFYQFLSKREINVDSHNGKNYDELGKEELCTISVQGRVYDIKKQQGTIITYYPAIYLRHKLIQKEIIAYVDNEGCETAKRDKHVVGKLKKRQKSKRRK